MNPVEKLPTLAYLLRHPQQPIIHRDLSWLQFNERVLAEARDNSNPLLKRLSFLSISSSNLDEFFMIRIASLQRSIASMKQEEARISLTRIQTTIFEGVSRFTKEQARTLKSLIEEFSRSDIFVHLKDLKNTLGFNIGKQVFQEQILPHLQAQNSFQFHKISELQNLQMLVYFHNDLWFEVPKNLPSVFRFIDKEKNTIHIFFLDDLLLSHLDHMLPIKEKPGILRVTRDSDFTIDLNVDDTESIPDLVRSSLGGREKGRFVRLQYNGFFTTDFFDHCTHTLKLDKRQIFRAPQTLCLQGLYSITNEVPEELSKKKNFNNAPLPNIISPSFRNKEHIFQNLKHKDFLLHHPYDSYDAFIAFMQIACVDPQVTMIEQTIYRTDSLPAMMNALKLAAKTKKVRVILELRARFDEWNNLQVADELGKAGVVVAFGFGTLKLHAKLTLITRKEEDKEIHYTHVSTGNYNSKTARQYTDIAILTANPEIGADARHFFDSVFSGKIPDAFQQLITAPTKLHQKIRSLIKAETHAAEAGKKARIVAKVNALVDEKIIEDLYHASQAGVQVELIVRGACSLIPGVKGLSDNIKVVSIVDRFLEHSRIYYFECSQAMYVSSADWMPRNFFSRLEIAYPVLDQRIFNFIANYILPAYINDTVKARKLNSRGLWVKREKTKTSPPMHAQKYFQTLAELEYKGTPLTKEIALAIGEQELDTLQL